jgi:hypothetical protein
MQGKLPLGLNPMSVGESKATNMKFPEYPSLALTGTGTGGSVILLITLKLRDPVGFTENSDAEGPESTKRMV